MNSKLKTLLFPLLLLTSCNNVSTHDDFALKGIEFMQKSYDINDFDVNIVGTYEVFDLNTRYDLNFKMLKCSNTVFYSKFDCDYPDYLQKLIDYLNQNRILKNYIIFNKNSDMKKYYASNEMIKVEDYSLFSNSDYTDSYTWNSEALLIEMTHYFKDENTNKPIAKATLNISKVE